MAVRRGLAGLIPGTGSSVIPMAVADRVDHNRKTIEVSADKDTVKDSPSVSTARGLSSEQAAQVRGYYRLQDLGGKRRGGGRVAMTAEVFDKFAQLITTALGLVAVLAWNTAIQALFTKLFGEAGAALVGQFAYAVLITLVVIFATIAVSRAADRAKRVEERLKEEQGKGLLGRLKE